jgi:hypothetical protein
VLFFSPAPRDRGHVRVGANLQIRLHLGRVLWIK